jgi:hypothetical protein
MGLGINPDTMEVKVRVYEPEGYLIGGSLAKTAGDFERRSRRLSGKLLVDFSLLCQTGERLVSYIGRGGSSGVSRLGSRCQGGLCPRC